MFSQRDESDPDHRNNAPKIIINGQEIDLNQYAQSGQIPPRIVVNGREIDLNQLAQSGGQAAPQVQIVSSQRPRRRSAGCGCLGIVFALIIALVTIGGIAAAILAVFSPNLLMGAMTAITGVRAPETRKIASDASNFDPFGAYDEISAFAGQDAQLIEINASYVRADGTMDLTATYSPSPYVDYKFAREVERPGDAPPVGVAGSTNGPWYEPITIRAFQPGQRRHTSITKGGVRTSFDWVNEGLVRDVSDPTSSLSPEFIARPQCSPADLWKAALEEDAPRDAVAVIRYDKNGYSFVISGAQVSLQFDMECKLKTR
jgi:hypothetical protein